MADDISEGQSGTAGRDGTGNTSPPVPSKFWYVAHLFLWVISGLVVYVLYKDTNRDAARRHLIVSLILGVVVAIAFVGLMVAVELIICGADPSACEYIDEW